MWWLRGAFCIFTTRFHRKLLGNRAATNGTLHFAGKIISQDTGQLWWEHSLYTKMFWVRVRRNIWVSLISICCSFSSLLQKQQKVFVQVLRFSPLLQNHQMSKFQFVGIFFKLVGNTGSSVSLATGQKCQISKQLLDKFNANNTFS